MWPFIIGGGALALGGYILYRWLMFKRKKPDRGKPASESPGTSTKDPGGSGTNKGRPDRSLTREEMLHEVVLATEFSRIEKERVSDAPGLGLKSRPSKIPGSNIQIRPIATLSEVASLLPTAQMLDDDLFYGRLASHSLNITEPLEYYGKSRKALLVLQDVSGSMRENERIAWARGLCSNLIDKCVKEGAEFILITFHSEPELKCHSVTRNEHREIKKRIPDMLVAEGGTDISLAIRCALEVIQKEKLDEARILLVTDGTEMINDQGVLNLVRNRHVFLHTVCIAGDHEQLRKASDRYDLLVA